MARILFLFCFLYTTHGLTVIPAPDNESGLNGRNPSSLGVTSSSPLREFHMVVRKSSKSWSTPEEVIPPEFFDIPSDQRNPNSSPDKELTIDDLYSGNADIPDYGSLGTGAVDDDTYEDEVY